MKTSKIFKKARERIESGKESYICFAINSVDLNFEDWIRARDVIRSRLDGFFSLDAWLYSKGVQRTDNMAEDLRAHRIVWLDQLIQEFKLKGD